MSEQEESQDWFLAPAWQDGEREADEDLERGRWLRIRDDETLPDIIAP